MNPSLPSPPRILSLALRTLLVISRYPSTPRYSITAQAAARGLRFSRIAR